MFDKFFIPLYMMGAAGMFAVLFSPFNTGEETGPVFMAMWALLYGITLAAVFARGRSLQKVEFWVFLIPLFFIVSTIWSPQGGKTFLYSITLLLNAMFAVYLSRRVNISNIPFLVMSVIVWLCALGLLANLLGFEATNYVDIHNRPTVLGIQPIKGFFFHKITAGYFASMAALLCLILVKGAKRIGIMAFLFVFTLLTGSSSGLALFFVGIGLHMLVRIFLHFKITPAKFLLSLISLCGFGIILFHFVGVHVLSLLDRDPTLTGRTLLWQLGIDASLERFFTGWGYLGYNGTREAQIAALKFPEFNNYEIPHFHNSYIQFLVDAGWIWGMIFIGLYFYTLTRWYGKALETPKPAFISITCVLLYMMVAAGFIHTLGRYNDLSMIFFLYALSKSAEGVSKKVLPILMRRLSVCIVIFVLFGASLATSSPAFAQGQCLYNPYSVSSDEESWILKNGINLSSSWRGDNPKPLTEQEYKALRALGITFVRLPVAEQFLRVNDAASQQKMIEILRCDVISLLNHGIAVVVDFHPSRHLKPVLAKEPPALLEDRLISYWTVLRQAIMGLPSDKIYISILNEPPAKISEWWKTQGRLIDALRPLFPDFTFIATVPLSSYEGYRSNVPYDDQNVIYDFHFYQPQFFTHHNASWVKTPLDPLEKTDRVLYPSSLEAEKYTEYPKMQNYVAEGWDKAKLEKLLLDNPIAWSKQTGARIVCLEFGVYKYFVDRDSRYRWLKDVRELFEENDIPWALWDYDGGFGLYDRKTGRMDTGVARALGLDARAKQ